MSTSEHGLPLGPPHARSGWGRHPVVQARALHFRGPADLRGIGGGIGADGEEAPPLIAWGNGRSYGDSALAERVLPMRRLDRMLGFDAEEGLLTCESGVLLSEIIDTFLPRGWFPAVVPGTRLITVGGAIAADVHGKNHHVAGCFGDHVRRFSLLLPGGQVLECSRSENAELFAATCGGMGLTGIVLEATLALKPVRSRWIAQTTVRTRNLQETFDAFGAHAGSPYSVAWIDCLARGDAQGRSLLMVGDFADDGDLAWAPARRVRVPFDFPAFALNSLTVRAFNALYWRRVPMGESQQRVGLESFFFPLDAVRDWNRIYGRRGFLQYQFILPRETSFEGLQWILGRIAESGMGSFLAVLKLYGPQNGNWLSFPMEGWSLALDFKVEPRLFPLLDELDARVVALGGRVYLAKDARMSRETLEAGYTRVEEFRALRQRLGLHASLQSLQSARLSL